jgi:copper transport protein
MPLFTAIRRLSLRLAFLAIATIAGPHPASAHATLIETTPALDARVAESLASVELVFDQPVELLSARAVELGGGLAPAFAGGETTGTRLRLRFGGVFPPGDYAIVYRAASADGHPIQGTLRFGVGEGRPLAIRTLASGDPEATYGWLAVAIFVRFSITAVAVVVAGGFLYALFIAVPGITYRSAAPRLACLGAALSLLDIGVRAAFLTDAPPLGLFDPALWHFGLMQEAGIARLAGVPGFLLLAFAWAYGASRAFGIAGTALVLLSLAGSSHATGPSPRWFGGAALALHLAAVMFWFGAFAPLIGALTRNGGASLTEVRRFARRMVPALIVIAATGAVLLSIQVGSIQSLLASDYATPLALKLAFVVVLLAIAAVNKWIRTPMLRLDPQRGAWSLARAIRIEGAVALGALGFATLLGYTAPPRVVAVVPHSALHLEAAKDDAQTMIIAGATAVAAVTLDPARAGLNRLLVALTDPDDLPMPGAVLTARFESVDGNATPVSFVLRDAGGGDYAASPIELPAAGAWRLTLIVEPPGAATIHLETEVTLK